MLKGYRNQAELSIGQPYHYYYDRHSAFDFQTSMYNGEAKELNIFSYPGNRAYDQRFDLFADSQLNHPTKERVYPVRGIALRYWLCDNKAMLTVSGTVYEITLLK